MITRVCRQVLLSMSIIWVFRFIVSLGVKHWWNAVDNTFVLAIQIAGCTRSLINIWTPWPGRVLPFDSQSNIKHQHLCIIRLMATEAKWLLEISVGWFMNLCRLGCMRSCLLCNIGYSSEPYNQMKSCETSFVHNFRDNCPIFSKYCTEYGGITGVLSAKLQNNWITDI